MGHNLMRKRKKVRKKKRNISYNKVLGGTKRKTGISKPKKASRIMLYSKGKPKATTDTSGGRRKGAYLVLIS